MPFTPFHMGPALAVKAFGGPRFSLLVFGLSQIAMDIEPLARLLRGDRIVHGVTHTYVGATAIAGLGVLIFKPLSELLLRLWNVIFDHHWTRTLRVTDRISWTTAVVTAFLGTWSHIFLDGLMHGDMQPWWPFAEGNSSLGLVSRAMLHGACMLAGFLGVLALAGFGTGGDEQN
jgi:hypothetical protein